jgi:polyisoprenyl-phosphate glycosyltransferase
MKKISIVTPCYNEELNVEACWGAVRDLFAGALAGYQYEHIFCDNASTDRTVAILEQIAKKDPAVKIIVNLRNFGPLKSNYNGVLASSGDAVLLCLVADMQDPPEMIPQFVTHWEGGHDIVYGIRAVREEGKLMRGMRTLFYLALNKLSGMALPPGVGDFQLVDKTVVDAMRKIEDAYPFMRLMTFECGSRPIGVPYTWLARKKGKSKNSWLSLIDQGMNGFVTFTTAPVRLALFIGFGIALFAMSYALVTLLVGIIYYRQLAEPGIPTLITALFFFSGVQLMVIGLVGEYVLAIYGQVRRRPIVFEKRRINFNPPPE